MNILHLYRLEVGRLFRNRLALLAFGLTALSPSVWLLLCRMMGTALTGSIMGCVLN